MKNKILASFYNPMEKDLPIFFRQTVEGKGVLQNIKFTSNDQDADIRQVCPRPQTAALGAAHREGVPGLPRYTFESF